MCRRCGAPLHERPRDQPGGDPVDDAPPPGGGRRCRQRTTGANVASPPRPRELDPWPRSPRPPATARPTRCCPARSPAPTTCCPDPFAATATAAAGPRRPRPADARGRHGERSPRAPALTRYARQHWRRILVLTVVAVALTMSVIAVWPVLFSTDANGPSFAAANAAQETRRDRPAPHRRRRRAHAVRARPDRSPSLTPSDAQLVLVPRSRSSVRDDGRDRRQVSMRVNSPKALTLATPADANRCVFARDEPAKGETQFVTVRTTDCRADRAPDQGLEHAMNACPACGKDVRPVWPTCRVVRRAADGRARARRCRSARRSAAPAPSRRRTVLRARGAATRRQRCAARVIDAVHTQPARSPVRVRAPAKWIVLGAGWSSSSLSAIGAAMFVIRPNASAQHQTPEVLPPRAPTAGLPTSLDVIVRVRGGVDAAHRAPNGRAGRQRRHRSAGEHAAELQVGRRRTNRRPTRTSSRSRRAPVR